MRRLLCKKKTEKSVTWKLGRITVSLQVKEKELEEKLKMTGLDILKVTKT